MLNVHCKATDLGFSRQDLHMLTVLAHQAASSIENSRLMGDLENTYMNAFGSMSLLLEAKDTYTKGHTERVTVLCAQISQSMGMNDVDLRNLILGARLHDIGKIGIPESILNKPGPLDEEEMLIVRGHPVIADRVVAPILFLQGARPIVRGHHERLDGAGYPDGLTAEELTLGQRIIIVVDAYDAMSSSRSYRPALSDDEVQAELERHLTTQFDSEVVDVLNAVLAASTTS